MEIINEQEKLGEEKNPVMPYEDAKALYEAQLDSNRQFFRNAARRDDTFGEVFLAGTQRFAQTLEKMPTNLRIYWGQGQISGAAVEDWAFNAVSNVALRTMGATKEQANILSKPATEIFSGKIGNRELRSRGEQMIIAANRNLEELKKRQQSEAIKLKDSHPILDGLISTGEQYAAAMLMAYVPLVGPFLSAAYMASLEASGTAEEGIEQYKQAHPEDKDLKGFVSDEKSVKEFTLNTLKTFVNGVEEYALGPAGQARYQQKMAKLAKQGFKPQRYGALKYIVKRGAIGGVQEFTEEGLLQGTSDTIFDYLLGRYKSGDDAVKAWKENLVQSGFAALYGTAFGVGGAIMDRASGIEATKNLLKDVVAEQDLDKVATVVFENELNNIMDIATVATEISSQLNTQKGEIYDAFRNAAFQAMKESGGYKGLTDESLWAHANEVSERLSQEAVAEAFKRKVPIQEVIDSNDIVYKDGELHLAKTDGESNLGKKINRVLQAQKKGKRPMSLLSFLIQNGGIKDSGGELKVLDAQKQRIGLINNKYGMDIDRARELAAEAGYFGGNPTDDIANTSVADFLELIDKELRGSRVYTPEAQSQLLEKEKALQDTDEAENFYERKLDEYGIDYSNMTFEEKEKAYSDIVSSENKEAMPSDDELEKIFGPEESEVNLDDLPDFFQESMDLADEMAAIDLNNDAYTGETININGVEKTVYNSNGDRIAKSEEALRAFYNWFGDSKVVDEQGRPLVVYHGTDAEQFSVFDGEYSFFTNNEENAKYFSKGFGKEENQRLMPVYLNMSNPLVIDAKGNDYNNIRIPSQIKSYFDDSRGVIDEIASATKHLGKNDGLIVKNVKEGSNIIANDYISFAPNQIKSTSNRGTYSLTDNNIYYQMFGEKANLTPEQRSSLDKAKEMKKNRVLDEQIRQETGWKYGKDGKWRLEVSDKDSKVKTESLKQVDKVLDYEEKISSLETGVEEYEKELKNNKDEYPEGFLEKKIKEKQKKIESLEAKKNEIAGASVFQLGEIFEHKNLYNAYPELKDLRVVVVDQEVLKNADGAYIPPYAGSWMHPAGGDEIRISRNLVQNKAELRKVLLHEIQHWIQHNEGFASGGSTETVGDIITKIADKLNNSYDMREYEDLTREYGFLRDVLEVFKVSKNPEKVLDTYSHLKNGSPFVPKKSHKAARKEYINEQYDIWWNEISSKYDGVMKYKFDELVQDGDEKKIQKDFKSLRQKIDRLMKKIDFNTAKTFETLSEMYENGEISARDLYNRLYGEMEARLVESRSDLSEKELRETPHKYDVDESDAIVVFDDGTAMSYKPEKFYQVEGLGKNAPVRRGSYDANSKVIKLFENANTSTLPHELAHYWLDNMWNYAKSGNANPQYVAQFNAVKNFLGVKPDQENLTRAQHEKFASAYEKYLYRGEFPTPIMGTVFANYERFIRDVYQSINDIRAQGKSKVRLTPEIIQFFDSMTSGELPTDLATTEMLNETRAEEVHQYDSKVVETVKKEVVPPESAPVVAPEATVKEILPVGSSGEVAESRLAKRTTEAMGIESDLQYERANIEKEREKAAEMWKNDPQKAQAELNNAKMGNEVLRNALYTEQQRIALENGDRDTFLKSLRKQSAEATRAGQELAALRGVVEDITMPSYWIRMAEWEAQKQLAKNMATYFDKVMGNTPLLNFTQKFDADVKALYEKVRKAETNAEKSKIMKEGLDEMKKTYRGLNQQEVGELFQTDWTNEELAYDYVEKKARDAVGLNLTNEKANAIIQASRDLDKLSRNVDEFGLPTAQFFAKKSELEYLINSHTPSSQTKVLLSTLGRANMLTAPATSVLNVASNVQNYGAQTLVRRLNNAITKHTNDNLVDSNLRKQYRKRVWDTFWATGYDLSMMNSIADTRLYRGESAVNSAGEGVIRQAGQWAEKHIFGELISSPDMVFKSYLAFTDFAGNEATDIAYKEGLTGDKAKARANELFTDAVKIEPKTEIGKQIRAKAQADALVITFQQDTKLARALLDLRNLVNKATGDVGVGDLLSAFVKTPANVLALGYDATVGPFGHLVNTFGAIQDARAGNLTSARVMATIRQTTTMAVMQAIVAAFALGFIDDDDYIPDYSQLSPSERLIVKERGASFGSIRIGDTYISTDFFGPFEVPLTAWLNARRQKGFADSASAYIGSVLRKGLDAPVIKDLLDQAKAAENVGSDSLSIWEHIYDTAGNLLISRLTPNVMNTLAKMSDDYERETNKSVLNKLIARVPVARKTLAPKMSVSTGKPVETPSALMQLLFGSRAHKLVDSTVSNELYRLYQAGERATISDITRSGDLKLIDEKEKQSAKEWFAREYSKAAERAIKTSTYRRKSDEDKKDELNKIRRDLVKQLKEKYKKKISVAKQKK